MYTSPYIMTTPVVMSSYVAWRRPAYVARAALARSGVRRSRMVDASRDCGENGWNVRSPAQADAGEASVNPTEGAPGWRPVMATDR